LSLGAAVTMRVLLAVLVLVVGEQARLVNAKAVLVVVAAASLWAIATWAGWYANSFTLTSSTITLRSGLLERSCRVIAVEAVQDVTTHQSLPGLLLGYGVVAVRLKAGPVLELTAMPDPEALRDHILAVGMTAAAARKTISGQSETSGWPA
jgi:uncharacterized membrane protein YdbT with pleckstrin-like domain